MQYRRFFFYFTIAFIVFGVAIGLCRILHEVSHPDPIVSVPEEENPFQSVDEALADAPGEDAARLRELLVAEESMPEALASSGPSAEPISLPAPTLSATEASEPAPVAASPVAYDAEASFENTKRLIDSYAALRDSAVSLYSPGNRKAIMQMQANAAKRAAQLPSNMPRPQR